MKTCPNCGKMYSDLVKVCPDCKVPLGGSAQPTPPQPPVQPVAPVQSIPTVQSATPVKPVAAPVTPNVVKTPSLPKKVGFLDAIKLFFTHYADFKTRSCRSEYWYVFLFNTIVALVIGFVLPPVASIWLLATLIPGLALAVRRLHDVGKSGWWLLFGLIPLAGPIILLVQFCSASGKANIYGGRANGLE